ncbi:MAG: hypothetical protein MJE77_02025 [Proteobacteria bacterium]|nr:hypothetical protein [Pseudomonadota bacterium]
MEHMEAAMVRCVRGGLLGQRAQSSRGRLVPVVGQKLAEVRREFDINIAAETI